MMELAGEMPVTLVIKAPNQRMADQTVDCMLGWTIKKLKKHLETVYPTKPKHNEQRLIYSGRLLQDDLTLKEILRQYDAILSNRYTVHLVCSSDSKSSSMTSLPNKPVSGNPHQATSASSSSSVENSSSGSSRAESLNTSKSEGLRYRGQLPEPSGDVGTPTSAPAAYQGGVPGDVASYSPEQYAWMIHQQQVYSQYMMQYMLYYQNMYNPGIPFNYQMPPSPLTQQQQHVIGDTHPQQQPAHRPEAAAANNGAPGAARPNVRMNAQGGMEEEEEDGEPRDWLHHMYFFMRILTFLGILFFYSNVSRFLIVVAGSFAVYILQRFRKYMQRSQQEQPQPQNQQAEQQQQQQGEHQQHGQDEQQTEDAAPTTPPQSEVGSGEQQTPDDDDGGKITRTVIFICNTIQAFFTSLLPTPPELLEPN